MRVLLLLCAMTCAFQAASQSPERKPPRPHSGHPGNVFLRGEAMAIRVPEALADTAVAWRIANEQGTLVGEGPMGSSSEIAAPNLGVGWYRVSFLDASGQELAFTTAAVLEPIAAAVPEDSPVCIDGALSWYPEKDMTVRAQMTGLAALTGVSWIRDRLRWREIEPERGQVLGDTPYDAMAATQRAAGLEVLQVFHGTPAWAQPDGESTGRIPDDLREAYRFCRAMADRFGGTVQAWESWNEGNAANFGGHTVDEMCSYQKACYLGFKAAAANVTVCWNPAGGVNTQTYADGVIANETWPYFERYSIHSYDWPHDYEKLWAPARQAASGRPIWVTECDRGMKAIPGDPNGDFAPEDDLRKAQFIAQSYATSLSSGASMHFHFILGHYMEQDNSIQFGLLRKDLTPRPSFVALAATGRFLAGARPLGRCVIADSPDTHIVAFRARPDGIERDVLVAWTENREDWDGRGNASAPWPLKGDVQVDGVFDFLGRKLPKTLDRIESAPCFILMAPGEADTLDLAPAPTSEYRSGQPSPVVLQLVTSGTHTVSLREGWTDLFERHMDGEAAACTIRVYNFGEEPVAGRITAESMPDGWEMAPSSWAVEVGPGERGEVAGHLRMTAAADTVAPWLRLRGDFGDAGRPVIAFRVLPSGFQGAGE